MINNNIVAVDTNFVRPGLDASHLIIENSDAAFVDAGTNYSVPYLLEALKNNNLDVADVKYVFVTHVHLDHAGGAGKLLQYLPNAKLVIHPRGAKHLQDPTKLIASAIGVYGKNIFSDLFGDIKPIPLNKMILVEDQEIIKMGNRLFSCFYTEGHARHHYCIFDEMSKSVFAGDSFGVSYRELDTSQGEFVFPSTSPTQFDPKEAHKAIDRILSYNPNTIYLTHYSHIESIDRLAKDLHRSIDVFVKIAMENRNSTQRTTLMRTAMEQYLVESLSLHNCNFTEKEISKILAVDIKVNTMGLEYWLDSNK
jgi:glyoxylase-like metal-dependent hydrolase (beta-lactamase superfamily II)|tara:strand:- start:18313 stop:19239 length:927 start_codon:yes stop_codon:yes gene_type:complete